MSASLKANEPSMEEILASIRRIIAEDTESSKQEEPQPAPAGAGPQPNEDDDVLDLATVASVLPADDIEFREIEDDATPSEPEPAPAGRAGPVQDTVTAREPPQAPVDRVSARPEEPGPALDTALLSADAAAAVAGAFGSLGAVLVPQNTRTLEDLVKDVLRPLLKGWLDENLPALVERLVKAEIERVSRHTRG